MPASVQIWEVVPDLQYVAASQHGPTYNGPLGRMQFTNGVMSHLLGYPAKFVHGRDLKGASVLLVVWIYIEGFEVTWIKDSWEYGPAIAPATPPKELCVPADGPYSQDLATGLDLSDLTLSELRELCDDNDVRADRRSRRAMVLGIEALE